MSEDDKDKKTTGSYHQSVPGTESIDDLLKTISDATFTLPPLTGGCGSGQVTMSTGAAASYRSYNYPTQPPIYTGNNIGGLYTSWGQAGATPVKISENGLDLSENCDIKIGEYSLKSFMKTVSDRLAILQPDPAKLEKFEALRQAYEHYKTLEALCQIEEKKDDK